MTVTFDQFYNNTLPQLVNAINSQANELVTQRMMIYAIGAVTGILIIGLVLSKFIKVERKKA